MAIQTITTGEQAVSATGAVTGTLDVSTLTSDFTIKVRVRDLLAGQKMLIGIEDTAGVTPFTDAICVDSMHFVGTGLGNEVYKEFRAYDDSSVLVGATNNKLRANVYRISSGATAKVEAWIE